MIIKDSSWWPIANISKPFVTSFGMSEKHFNADENMNPDLDLWAIVSRVLERAVILMTV